MYFWKMDIWSALLESLATKIKKLPALSQGYGREIIAHIDTLEELPQKQLLLFLEHAVL